MFKTLYTKQKIEQHELYIKTVKPTIYVHEVYNTIQLSPNLRQELAPFPEHLSLPV